MQTLPWNREKPAVPVDSSLGCAIRDKRLCDRYESTGESFMDTTETIGSIPGRNSQRKLYS